MNWDAELVELAIEFAGRAYAPYSGIHVGAALRCADGSIIGGCNVENASYGLTICAERVAMSTAVANGKRKFSVIAVASVDGITPCGACRQFLAEFEPNLRVLLCSTKDPEVRRILSMDELLPARFKLT